MQITTFSSAKSASSGLDFLASTSGDPQNSKGFEDQLSSQMDARAPSRPDYAQAPKPANGKGGKETGNESGKKLPDDEELPAKDAKPAVSRPVTSHKDKPAKDGEPKEETSEDAAQQPVSAERVPLAMVPLLVAAEQAAGAPGLSSEDGTPLMRGKGLLPEAAGKAKPAMELPVATDQAEPAVPATELPVAKGSAFELPVAKGLTENLAENLAEKLAGKGQQSGNAQAAAAQAITTQAAPAPAIEIPVSLDPEAGKADQPTPVAKGLLAAQNLPIQALNGNAIRLRPVTIKESGAGKDNAAAPATDPASLVPAEDTATLVPTTPGEEAVPSSTTSAKPEARIAGLSAKDRLDLGQQLAGNTEARQDASGLFGSSAQAQANAAQSNAASPNGHVASVRGMERPHDFAALVDQLVAAREFATPKPVFASVNHAEFGQVSLKFEQGDRGLSVAVSSADPDFARAVQAAAPSDKGGAMNENREGSSSGNSAAFRQDAQAQSSNTGTQAHSRDAGGNDKQAGEGRSLRGQSASTGEDEAKKPRQSGIFA